MNYLRMRNLYLSFHSLEDWFKYGVWDATRSLEFLCVVEPNQ